MEGLGRLGMLRGVRQATGVREGNPGGKYLYIFFLYKFSAVVMCGMCRAGRGLGAHTIIGRCFGSYWPGLVKELLGAGS